MWHTHLLVTKTLRLRKTAHLCGRLPGITRTFKGDVWGPYMSVQFLPARRCTFQTLHILLSIWTGHDDGNSDEIKKKKTPAQKAAYHFTKRILTVDYKVVGEMYCGAVKTAVWWRAVSPPAPNVSR